MSDSSSQCVELMEYGLAISFSGESSRGVQRVLSWTTGGELGFEVVPFEQRSKNSPLFSDITLPGRDDVTVFNLKSIISFHF